MELVVATGLLLLLAAAVISTAWAFRRTVETRADRRIPRAVYDTILQCVADLEQAFDPGTGNLLELHGTAATTQVRIVRLGATDDDSLRTAWQVEWIAVSNPAASAVQVQRIARPFRGPFDVVITQTAAVVWKEWIVEACDGTNYTWEWPRRDGPVRPASVRLRAAALVGSVVHTAWVEVVMRSGRSVTSQYERHGAPRPLP